MIRALLLSLALCTAAAAAPHRTLTIGVSSFPSTLNPAIDADLIKFYVLGFIDRPVTAWNADRQLQCFLCTEAPTVANGGAKLEGDGMAVTVRFKPGLTWADGAPLGAEDLAFTARVGRDPSSGFTNTKTWERVSRVDVLDPQTAVMHLSEPFYQYGEIAELLPAHLEQPIYKANPKPGDYIQHSLYNRDPTNPGLYNGPYRITADDVGSQLVLDRNEHWTGAWPYFDRVIIKTIGNTAALQANLLSGDIDMAPGDAPALTLDQVLTLQRQYPARFAYAFKPNQTYTHIDLQLDNPALADVRVRRALLMAIDRQGIVDKLLGGRVPVATSFVGPLESTYTADVPQYPHDPAKAAALLAEAGWTPGPDGIRRNAAGQRLNVEFTTTVGVRFRELQQQVIQSEWRGIGVESDIKNEPPRTLFGETLKHRSFPGAVLFAWVLPVEGTPRQILSSGQIPMAANNWGGTNYMDFRNPQMDADIDAVERELDPAKRAPIWADMQRIYANQLPALPLNFSADAYVWPTWLHGVQPTGHAAPTTLWAEQWLADE